MVLIIFYRFWFIYIILAKTNRAVKVAKTLITAINILENLVSSTLVLVSLSGLPKNEMLT